MPESSLHGLLSVGCPVIVDPSVRALESQRFPAYVRGWQDGEYILFDTPVDRAKVDLLQQGAMCVMRFMAEGQACAFSSTVLDRGSGAYFAFFRVRWPQQFQAVAVRKHSRLSLELPCTVHGGDADAEATILDLSMGGVGIRMPAGVPCPDAFHVTFALPDGAVMNRVAAVRCSQRNEASATVYGCAFESITDLQRADLEFFLATATGQLRREGEGGPWVLVIDPNPSWSALLKGPLRTRDIRVVTALNGVHGCARLAQTVPLAVLVAAAQDGCSGLDVVRVLARTLQAAECPLFLYGSDGSNAADFEARAREAGSDGYFPSTSNPGPLVNAVVRALDTAS
jgi:c-di-GMP-binding flagellar brake protein YcgR/CheY-like chemotaxis protein